MDKVFASSLGKERKKFFFEKKNQKTFITWCGATWSWA
jgi:hypothetical protein